MTRLFCDEQQCQLRGTGWIWLWCSSLVRLEEKILAAPVELPMDLSGSP